MPNGDNQNQQPSQFPFSPNGVPAQPPAHWDGEKWVGTPLTGSQIANRAPAMSGWQLLQSNPKIADPTNRFVEAFAHLPPGSHFLSPKEDISRIAHHPFNELNHIVNDIYDSIVNPWSGSEEPLQEARGKMSSINKLGWATPKKDMSTFEKISALTEYYLPAIPYSGGDLARILPEIGEQNYAGALGSAIRAALILGLFEKVKGMASPETKAAAKEAPAAAGEEFSPKEEAVKETVQEHVGADVPKGPLGVAEKLSEVGEYPAIASVSPIGQTRPYSEALPPPPAPSGFLPYLQSPVTNPAQSLQLMLKLLQSDPQTQVQLARMIPGMMVQGGR